MRGDHATFTPAQTLAIFTAMCPIRPNVLWALDFQFDTSADGRTLKMLNVIDEFTREALAIEVDRTIDADHVVTVLYKLVAERGGAPVYVRFDNGPEFVAHAVRTGADSPASTARSSTPAPLAERVGRELQWKVP
jgi:transposase InsO family protein